MAETTGRVTALFILAILCICHVKVLASPGQFEPGILSSCYPLIPLICVVPLHVHKKLIHGEFSSISVPPLFVFTIQLLVSASMTQRSFIYYICPSTKHLSAQYLGTRRRNSFQAMRWLLLIERSLRLSRPVLLTKIRAR